MVKRIVQKSQESQIIHSREYRRKVRYPQKKGRNEKIFRSFALSQEAEHYRAVYYHPDGAILPSAKTRDPPFFDKAQDSKLFS